MSKSRQRSGLLRILIIIFLINFGLGLIHELVQAISRGKWEIVLFQLLPLLVLGLIFYRLRPNLQKIRERSRRRFEEGQQNVSLRDAAIFSLSWSREIFQSIPKDRRKLVNQALLLIGIGLGLLLLQSHSGGLFTVLLVIALVLAGINLLVWVVASEREEKSRLQIELEAARHMQLSLMPTHDPQLSGYDISGICIPAQSVGGDHFDYVWLGDRQRKFAVAMADVAGKGMDAAWTAVYTSGAFFSAVQSEENVGRVMKSLNRAICSRQDRKRFVSFFILALESESRNGQYVNAGQTRPLLLRQNRVSVLQSEEVRFPLGVMAEANYRALKLPLQSGDVLLLYTDGVSEAMDREQNPFGEKRLSDLFQRVGQQPVAARQMVEDIKKEILAFSDPNEQHDDITIVVIRALADSDTLH